LLGDLHTTFSIALWQPETKKAGHFSDLPLSLVSGRANPMKLLSTSNTRQSAIINLVDANASQKLRVCTSQHPRERVRQAAWPRPAVRPIERVPTRQSKHAYNAGADEEFCQIIAETAASFVIEVEGERAVGLDRIRETLRENLVLPFMEGWRDAFAITAA
jgi:hypothetical protein